MTNPLWDAIQNIFVSLEKSQRDRLWSVANQINPHFVLDDLLNPHDHPQLLSSPKFNFEDGYLSGIQASRIAVNGLLKSLETHGLDAKKPQKSCFPQGWYIEDVHAWQVRESILKTRALNTSKKPPAVVFDLDGTLFDVSSRTLGIFREWLKSEEAHSFPAQLIKRAQRIDFEHVGYSLRHAVENAGFTLEPNSQEAQFFSLAQQYWQIRFFDGTALVRYDCPIPGASDFVWQLQEDGFTILYLSGRSKKRMAQGTQLQLEKHGFPIKGTHTFLKDNSKIDDHDYKRSQFAAFKENYSICGNFENEYINLFSMAKVSKSCVHVIVNSKHSARQVDVLDHPIFRISSFL